MARTPTKPKKTKTPPAREKGTKPCPVVGIGASAGGIHALEMLLPGLKHGCGVAIVVVMHLHPDLKSSLPEVLARFSTLPVTQIQDKMAIEPDHIYVIPPNASLTLEKGLLRLVTLELPRGLRSPIDTFFASLADDCGANAACIVLSGTGSDGTIGLRAIKEHGGLALAQAGAEYDGMMRSALATGLVDFVLPVEEMPAKLAGYFDHATRRIGHAETASDAYAEHLGQICAILRTRTGHDFSGYKDRTVVRRIQRRMQVLQIDKVTDFIERLRTEPREVELLFQDMLIGVTRFFRDPKVWEVLENEVIPKLFEGKGPDDAVRVWVPGCATGEEAYSIAMLLRECTPKSHGSPTLQVFASDIDDAALETARLGRYPASIVADVPRQRLERYFVREDSTYRVASELREICLFSRHNLLRDAPFSRVDLISCRNLLIYLDGDLQNRVIPLFHYALRDNSYLLLGTSENVSRHARLFGTLDKTNRIFLRLPQTERRLPEFPLTAPEAGRRVMAHASRPGPADVSLRSVAERELLDRYAPAYVIIDADGEVVQSSGRTGKYLELPAGSPSNNIYSMARSGLRPDLRVAVHRAIGSGSPSVYPNLSVGTNGGRQAIDLIVQPLRPGGAADNLYMVVFRDVGDIAASPELEAAESPDDAAMITVRQLEADLVTTKERLQTTTEELESSNEELKSGNEELSSMNEELQSANEELETSKEELQSVNEELQTVNAELNARVEELSRANNDIANLLESTQIATLFLDNELNIKSFTPAAKDLFRFVESDTGRPITHVRSRFGLDTLYDDAQRVLRTLSAIERTISADAGARYMMRILPYRTVDNVIGGVVITFDDVTQIGVAEARIGELTRDLHVRIENLETTLDLVPVGIFMLGTDTSEQVLVNRHGARLLGEDDGRKGLRPLAGPLRMMHDHDELLPAKQPLMQAARTGSAVARTEARLMRADGETMDVMISATPLFASDGAPRGAIAAIIDISRLKQSEAQREALVHELQHRVKNVLATVCSLAARMVRSSASLEDFSSAFLGRLMAMGAMHELLSARDWQGADLEALVVTAVGAYAGPEHRSLGVAGPEIVLKSNAAATLGMVFHELATNAAKYGALSLDDGRVRVDWQIERERDGRRLSLTWAEIDGPRIDPPNSEGFGTVFVQRSVQYEMGGTAAFEFEPTGLSCTISFPFEYNVERAGIDGTADGA